MRRRSAEKKSPVIIGRIQTIGEKSKEAPSVLEVPDYSERLLRAVTGARNNNEAEKILKSMHPGVRELRFRNEIAKFYENWGWQCLIRDYTRAKHELEERHGLKEPTAEEKLEAVRDESNLTDTQKLALMSRFAATESNLEAAASIQLKLRNTDANKLSLKIFTLDEKKILDKLLPGKAPLEEKATPEEFARLKKELIQKFEFVYRNKNGHNLENKVVFPSCLALFNGAECGIETLRSAVRKKKEAETVLEFMGKKPQHEVVFRHHRGLTHGKEKGKNEDAKFSADIHVNGKTKRLDAVFDGVGESDKAESASGMAVEVFKLGLMLKPPESEKDLELLMSMTDLAIFTEKAAETGLSSSMTTAVAVLSDGKKAIACHVGDSKWMIFRDNRLMHFNIDHTYAEEIKQNLRENGHSPAKCAREFSNAITSALGSDFRRLESHTFKLKKGDIILLCSDGISDTVWVDEMEKIFSEDSEIEISETRISDLARSRDDYDKEYDTIVGSIVKGKFDDKTLILQKIEK